MVLLALTLCVCGVGRAHAMRVLQVEGKWHTWIDYPKFHELVKRYKATDGEAVFTAMDYMAPTPDVSCWADGLPSLSLLLGRLHTCVQSRLAGRARQLPNARPRAGVGPARPVDGWQPFCGPSPVPVCACLFSLCVQWAVYNAPEGGFDPVESRFRRNAEGAAEAVEYKASSSGCG